MNSINLLRRSSSLFIVFIITTLVLGACSPHFRKRPELYATGKILSLKETINLPKGAKIRIRFKNGTVRWGFFLGYRKMPSADYLDRYNDGKKEVQRKIVLPAIHETIRVQTKDHDDYFAEFLGFDLKTLHLRPLDEPESMMLPVNRLQSITDINGYKIENRVLEVLTRYGEIPYNSILIFREQNKSLATQIGIEKIVYVQYIRRKDNVTLSKLHQTGLIVLPVAALLWLSFLL